MPRVKRFKDDAERLKAWRSQRRQVRDILDRDTRGTDAAPTPAGGLAEVERSTPRVDPSTLRVCFEGRMEVQTRFPKMTEEAYVAISLADCGTSDPQRRERAERYARWRYNGYCCGKVGLL